MRIYAVIYRIGYNFAKQNDLSGNIFNKFIAFVCRRNADAGWQNVDLWWTLPFNCSLHQYHNSLLYETFKLTVYVPFLQYDFLCILGLL